MVVAPRNRGNGERTLLRLALFGVLIVSAFVALFSRLWFLQVLAVGDYQTLAQQNRVRLIHSEPPRGRILDRNGKPLVTNESSLAVTIDKQVLDAPVRRTRVLAKLALLLDEDLIDLRTRLRDVTVSPYKPVAVAFDIKRKAMRRISENPEDFPGVGLEEVPSRIYPQKDLAPHILGYVREITEDQLDSDHFAGAKPAYKAGDLVGQAGLEYTYDRYLRGRPEIKRVVVNAAGEPIGRTRSDPDIKQEQLPGYDLVTTLDADVQRVTQAALESGVAAGNGVGGAAVVMDPQTGGIVAMASWPTYDPRIVADGITNKEYKKLGAKTPNNPDDDRLFNRAIQGERAPGSTFKTVTAGAALATDIIGPYDTLPCPGAAEYPPGHPGATLFNNWTSANFGIIGFPRSLEISCDTFYYELGWRLETNFGPSSSAGGDGSERFQDFMRLNGFGAPTGIDLPNEGDGRVPDVEWLEEFCAEIECLNEDWLPGYTINMSIGQGDLTVTPLQMAVHYSALANGGQIMQPHIAASIEQQRESGTDVKREFEGKVLRELPLDDTEMAVIREGLTDVIASGEGTARTAFTGFPLDVYPISGKTGTAEVDKTAGYNDAWFVSYGPTNDPQYVVSVYVEKTFGHGGEIAAPIAREIFEGIFDIDKETDVQLGQDASG